MAAPIGNFQFELENALQRALNQGLGQIQAPCQPKYTLSTVYDRNGKFINFQNIDWITSYFENCQKMNSKSGDRAATCRADGNMMFQRKMYKEALIKYSEAVQHAPRQSEVLAVAFGNRSAVLYRLQQYKECVSDINEAISSGFPEGSLHKLLLRKAQCLHQLGCKELQQECLEELQSHLVKMPLDSLKKDDVLKEMEALKESSPCTENIQPYDYEGLPCVSYGNNLVLVQASSAVSLQHNPQQGRFLVANSPIKAGDTLIVEKPFAAVLLPDHYPTHCHHCFGKIKIAYSCRQCTPLKYCSPACARSSWDTYHQFECHYLQLLHSVGIAHLSLRVVLVAGLQFLLEFREKQKCFEQVQKVAGIDKNGQYCRNYQTVYDLMTHIEDMSTEDLFQYTMCSQIGDNTIVEEKSQVRIATAIYPTASLMNHSCDPTIISSFSRDVLVVRAVKDVPAGGEIFNCYGPHFRRMEFTERQRCLSEQYFFRCQCQPCTDGESIRSRFEAYRCRFCSGPAVQTRSDNYVCEDCKVLCSVDPGKVKVAEALFQRGIEFLHDNNIGDALTNLQKCYTVRRDIMYKYHRQLSEVQDCLARCHAMSGNFIKATEFLQGSIEIVEQIFGTESIEVANELQKLSEILISAQKWDDALTANQKACCIFEMHYGKSHDIVKELTAARMELLQVVNSVK